MNSGGDAFYAVVIICLFIFLILTAYLCIRVRKRYKRKLLEQPLQHHGNEWEQLRSVVTHDVPTDPTLLSVSSKVYIQNKTEKS